MPETEIRDGVAGDPAAQAVAATAGCCGGPPQATLVQPDPNTAGPCCGTAAEARAANACCGTAARSDAVAAGTGCCG